MRHSFVEILVVVGILMFLSWMTPVGGAFFAAASEVITGYGNETVTVLNEELRKRNIDEQIKMISALNMRSKKITNLTTPTANSDAATKLYVDQNRGYVDGYNVSNTGLSDGDIIFFNQTASEWQPSAIGSLESTPAFQTIFHWNGATEYVDAQVELYIGDDAFGSSNPAASGHSFIYWTVKSGVLKKILDFQFMKTVGMDTAMIIFRMASSAVENTATCVVNCGGLTRNLTSTATSPGVWLNSTGWNISSLTDGTIYNGNISCINSDGTSGIAYVGSAYVYAY